MRKREGKNLFVVSVHLFREGSKFYLCKVANHHSNKKRLPCLYDDQGPSSSKDRNEGWMMTTGIQPNQSIQEPEEFVLAST